MPVRGKLGTVWAQFRHIEHRAQTILSSRNLLTLYRLTHGAGRGEPKPALRTGKLLIVESTKLLKSPEARTLGTIRAQNANCSAA